MLAVSATMGGVEVLHNSCILMVYLFYTAKIDTMWAKTRHSNHKTS